MAVVEYPTDVARDAGMARGEWDVAAGPETPEEAAARGRALAVPFLEVDNTLLVGPDSAIRSTADMDRPGVRLAATAGSPPERNLSGLVTRAEIVRVANNADLVPLLAAGQVEALASNRPNVLAFAAQVPGARVLADRYAVQPAAAHPRARPLGGQPRAGVGRDAAGAGVRADPREHRPRTASWASSRPPPGAGRAAPDRGAAAPAGRGRGRRAGRGGGGPAGGRSAREAAQVTWPGAERNRTTPDA